jgi:hypothetical protein
VIRVQDNGIGIEPAALERIFQPFEQGEAGLTRVHGGTGLGLSISRDLARLMGGDVVAQSTPHQGSTFLLYVPAVARARSVGENAPSGERRGRGRYVPGLSVVGDALLTEIERILDSCMARLREDPATPKAHALSRAEVDDHTAALLADLAQTLRAIDAARGASSPMLRDGTAIQSFVAELHGVLRARMGWTTGELLREFEVLREEILTAIHRRLPEMEAADPAEHPKALVADEALAILMRFAEQAEQASFAAFERTVALRSF